MVPGPRGRHRDRQRAARPQRRSAAGCRSASRPVLRTRRSPAIPSATRADRHDPVVRGPVHGLPLVRPAEHQAVVRVRARGCRTRIPLLGPRRPALLGRRAGRAVQGPQRRTAIGDEVPQVYLGPSPNVPAGVQQAVRKLVQFDRMTLWPGGQRRLTLHVDARELSYWSTAQQRWIRGTGRRDVYVGSSSRDIREHASAHI